MERWKQDVLTLRDEVGVKRYIHGDDWIGKWERAKPILEFMYSNSIDYDPSMRANQVTDSVAKEMARIGVRHVSIGMESGSPRLLKLIQKDITVEDQLLTASALARYGIRPLYYWITGFPTETDEDFKMTVEQADKVAKIHDGKLVQNFYTYTAMPGSPLFDLVDKDKLPHTMEEWSNYTYNTNDNVRASNLYMIGGMRFHRGKGEKTDQNFPGWRRAYILPWEAMIALRWKLRWFSGFSLEKWCIERLLEIVTLGRQKSRS